MYDSCKNVFDKKASFNITSGFHALLQAYPLVKSVVHEEEILHIPDKIFFSSIISHRLFSKKWRLHFLNQIKRILRFYQKDGVVRYPNFFYLKYVAEYDCWEVWVDYSSLSSSKSTYLGGSLVCNEPPLFCNDITFMKTCLTDRNPEYQLRVHPPRQTYA